MNANFKKLNRFLLSKSLLACFLIVISFGNASIAYSENLNQNINANKHIINLSQNSFSLFTGCNTALNLLGGTPYYDNDCKTDISIWRPGATGQFWINKSSQNNTIVHSFGTTGDMPLGGDYDGDGITDLVVYRTSNNEGRWHILNSSNSVISGIHFGTPNVDLPIPADYNNDNKTDIAIFRIETEGNVTIPRFFYRTQSAPGYLINSLAPRTGPDVVYFPVVKDYDNDGNADIAVWRQNDGLWEIKNSSTNTFRYEYWGSNGDIPVSGNYAKNGVADGVVDLAYYRPSTGDWHIINSNGGSQAVHFGTIGDKPVPGDYDGDGIWDFAIQRDVAGHYEFHILGSTDGYYVTQYGLTGDIPIALVVKDLPTGPVLKCPVPICSDQCPRGCR